MPLDLPSRSCEGPSGRSPRALLGLRRCDLNTGTDRAEHATSGQPASVSNFERTVADTPTADFASEERLGPGDLRRARVAPSSRFIVSCRSATSAAVHRDTRRSATPPRIDRAEHRGRHCNAAFTDVGSSGVYAGVANSRASTISTVRRSAASDTGCTAIGRRGSCPSFRAVSTPRTHASRVEPVERDSSRAVQPHPASPSNTAIRAGSRDG